MAYLMKTAHLTPRESHYESNKVLKSPATYNFQRKNESIYRRPPRQTLAAGIYSTLLNLKNYYPQSLQFYGLSIHRWIS